MSNAPVCRHDFYAEESFVPPLGAFAPPNVFDRFVRLETLALRDENAALQQANSATVSMASKIAQTMSDANGQVSRQPGCAPFPVC